MTRLNSRSNRSRGRHLADVGRGARGPRRRAGAPGADAGVGHVGRGRRGRSAHTREDDAAEQDHAQRAGHEPGGPLAAAASGGRGRPTGWPQRWQKRAWGESSARQCGTCAGVRLAPQALQKLPGGGGAAGRGTAEGGCGHRERSVNRCRSRGKDAVAGLDRTCLTAGRRRRFLSAVPLARRPISWRSQAASAGSAERPEPRRLPHRPERGAARTTSSTSPSRFGVDFIRLQFTDILGVNKNVEVPRSQFEKALDGEIMFDGSSIEGFVRIEESDMLLKPDLAHLPDPAVRRRGRPGGPAPLRHLHAGRGAVRRLPPHDAQAPARAGPEARLRDDGGLRGGVLPVREGARRLARPPITHDSAAYFDLGPVDKGEEIRRVIVEQLVEMGFEVEAAHHEVATGQHEIDFKYADALITADNLDHVQVRRPERGQPLRLHRVVHAQADPGHQRQRHAHPPVAVPGQGQRLLRPRRPSTSSPRRR